MDDASEEGYHQRCSLCFGMERLTADSIWVLEESLRNGILLLLAQLSH